jgi:hypothetical protein
VSGGCGVWKEDRKIGVNKGNGKGKSERYTKLFLDTEFRPLQSKNVEIKIHTLKEITEYLKLTRASDIQTLGLKEVEVPRISRQSAFEGGKVVSPTHRPLLPSRKDPEYSYLLEAESTPGP